MANNQADGSLVIDTKLDNAGFEKGSDKLLDAIKNLTGAVDNMGDNMMKSFAQVVPLLSSVAASAASANAAMANGALQASEANARAIIAEQQLAQATQAAADAARKQEQEMSVVNVNAMGAKNTLSGLETQINSVSTSMNGLDASAMNGFSNGKSVLSFDAKLSQAADKIDNARHKLDEFGATKIPTDAYQWLTENIKKADNELNRLYDRQQKMEDSGVKKNSRSWKALVYDLSLAQQKIRDYKDEQSQLEAAGQAFKLGSQTDEYKRMKETLDGCTSSLDRNRALINSEAIEQARLNVQAAQEEVIRASNDRQRASAMATLQSAQQEMNRVAAQASTPAPPKEDTVSGWQRFGSVLKSVGSAAVRITGTLARMSFKAMASGIKSATNRLKDFISQSKKASTGAKTLVKALTGIKTMLKSRIKRMFISAIINNIKESMKSLVQMSTEFDRSMSNIRNRGRELASNITVSLGSLIMAIEPMLTKIIDAASTAISYLNALVASMQGKSKVTIAKKQMDSYAASTKDAAEAAEDLKNQTYGFDQLNKQVSNSADSKTDGTDKYEEVSIDSLVPDDIEAWFDRIKSAFQNGDWFTLGQIIAEGLNTALQTVDTWINNSLRPKAVSWVSNIAQVLNGLVDGFDWTLAGKTLADGVNTMFDTVNTFLTTFDFGALGSGVADAINGIFDNIDWPLIGQTFANKWNALIDFIFGLVSTIDWPDIGKSVSDLIDNFVNGIKLEKLAQAAGILINGLFGFMDALITNTDWGALAKKLGDSINSLFSTIDFAGAIKTIVQGFNAIVQTLADIIFTIDWYSIGKDLADSLTSLITNIDWAALGQLISNAVLGLLDLLIALIGETDWGALIQNILAGIGALIENIDWGNLLTKLVIAIGVLFRQIPGILVGALGGLSDLIGSLFEAMGLDSIAGFFKGIGDSLANVGAWLKKHLVDPVVNGVKNLFGIHSPSTVFAEMGDFLIQGLFNGISGAWGSIINFFSSAADGLKNLLSGAWDGIKNAASSAWTGIKGAVTGAWDDIKSGVSDACSAVKERVSDTWDKADKATNGKLTAIKDTTTSIWDGIKNGISNAITATKDHVSNTWDLMKNNTSDIGNGIKDSVSNAWSTVKSVISGDMDGAKNNAAATWDSMKSTASSVGGNIKNAVSNAFTNVKNAVSNQLENAKNISSNAWNAINSATGGKLNEIKNTVSNATSSVRNYVSDAWSSIKSNTESRWSDIKSSISEKWSNLKSFMGNTDWNSVGSNLVAGVKEGISGSWDHLSSWFSDKWSGLVGGVKSFLGIHSPSTVFASIGDYMIQGLQVGMEEEKGNALKTATNIAAGITNKFDDASPEITISEDATVAGLDAVADRLSGIAATFNAITSALNSMGGFRMPQMAAGTVVPVKTRIEANPTIPDNTSGLTALTDMSSDVDERMADISYTLKQLLAIVKALNLNIDINALTEMITHQQGTSLRNFGGA